MKIGLYINEIIYNIGGTESYTAKLCYALQQIYPDAKISFVSELYKKEDALSDKDFIVSVNSRFGTDIDANRAGLIAVPANKTTKIGRFLLRKRFENVSKKFDMFFYCSRGNYVFKAKKNIHIIHFPTKPIAVQKQGANPLVIWYEKQKDKAYLKAYDLFLPNSKFTEKHHKLVWQGINDKKLFAATKLCYHFVAPIKDLNLPKEKLILVMSRIEPDKYLETLIDAYMSSDFLRSNYKMVIAGGFTRPSRPTYKEELEERVKGSNVSLVINAPFSKIVELYNRAQIFWHCKGYGIDENARPDLMEHFGMTTVEAMSAGCVPIVINAAGQKEIVTDECGFKWNTIEELVAYTEGLCKQPDKIKEMSRAAKERVAMFCMDNFIKNMKALLDDI